MSQLILRLWAHQKYRKNWENCVNCDFCEVSEFFDGSENGDGEKREEKHSKKYCVISSIVKLDDTLVAR